MSKKKSLSKKTTSKHITTEGIGGLRDIAEILSTSYFLLMSRVQIAHVEEMMDMDKHTLDLAEMDPQVVTALLQDDFGKGFLMGMFHQSYTYQMLAEEHEREEGE